MDVVNTKEGTTASAVPREKKCRCGGADHQRTSSKLCKFNKKVDPILKEAQEQALLDLVEIEEDVNEEETEETLQAIDESNDLEEYEDEDEEETEDEDIYTQYKDQ